MKNFGYKKIFDFKTQIPNDKDLDSLALILSGITPEKNNTFDMVKMLDL